MSQSMSKMLMFVGIFFLIVFGVYGVKKMLVWWFMSHYKPPATLVSAAAAQTKNWQPYLKTVGSLTAVNGVDLSTEVSGIIDTLPFTSGDTVHKGDVILTLRREVENANLKNAEAKLTLANLNYTRQNTLFAKKVSSQAMLDQSLAEKTEAEAAVDAIHAAIQQKTISAPFDGRLGIRQVNVGQYISPGTPVVTLQSVDPLYVQFNLPEQNVSSIHLGQKIDVNLHLKDDITVNGTITAINSKVDAATRNVLIQASIPNQTQSLYPGMYGLVTIWLGDSKSTDATVVIPQTAIAYALSGDYVYLIKADEKKKSILHAYKQPIKIGERRGDAVSITEGVRANDLVVTAGQLKLKDGMVIALDHPTQS